MWSKTVWYTCCCLLCCIFCIFFVVVFIVVVFTIGPTSLLQLPFFIVFTTTYLLRNTTTAYCCWQLPCISNAVCIGDICYHPQSLYLNFQTTAFVVKGSYHYNAALFGSLIFMCRNAPAIKYVPPVYVYLCMYMCMCVLRQYKAPSALWLW